MSDATNPTGMPAVIAEARELDKGATKGPWTVRPHPHDDWGLIRAGDGRPVADTGTSARCNEFRNAPEGAMDFDAWEAGPPEVAANAALIARYRTLCPLLADAAERLATENAELEKMVLDGADDRAKVLMWLGERERLATQAAEALEHRKRQALEIDRLEGELARVTGERDALAADRDRLDWLQEKYGEHPWKLVGMIPGTNDVRVAIDRAKEQEAIDAARGEQK